MLARRNLRLVRSFVFAALISGLTGCPNRDTGFDDSRASDTPATGDTGNLADTSDDVVDVGAVDTQDAPSGDTGAPRVVDIVIPGDPPITGAPGHFAGPDDPSRAPRIVYPTPGTIVPPNLRGLEVHFTPGSGNSLFEVSFTGGAASVRIFTRCMMVARGCVLTLDDMAFRAVVDASRPGDEMQLRVRGTTDAAGAAVGSSAPQVFGVADMDLRGGIYYWHVGTGSVYRYEWGLPGAHEEVYLRGDTLLPSNCVGCHALSRDGRRIAVPRGIPMPTPTRIIDVATRGSPTMEFRANFSAFSPDASRLIVSDGVRLSLVDGNTGLPSTELPADMVGSHPDWAADGVHVMFSRPRFVSPLAGTSHGAPADLMLMNYMSGTFTTPTYFIAATTENNYYPAFSPDNEWVLWNRAAGPSADAQDSQLWAIRFDRTGAPQRLANAEGRTTTGNSWPKWAPFLNSYAGEPLLWFTFTTRRDYGFRLENSARMRDSQIAQLWMAAFRPMRGRTGDASASAFYLPFQNAMSGNHIAQWTQEVRRVICRTDADCAMGEQCVALTTSGQCVGRM